MTPFLSRPRRPAAASLRPVLSRLTLSRLAAPRLAAPRFAASRPDTSRPDTSRPVAFHLAISRPAISRFAASSLAASSFGPLRLAAFCFAVFLGSLSPAAAGDNEVSLNFANADIDSVIRAIGKITGRNFLIDPRVKGTLNIVTNQPVTKAMTYPILLSALRLQGYTAIEAAGVTKIVPEADAKLHAVPVGKSRAAAAGDRVVTQVFTLRNESAVQMVPVVRPLVSPNNTVVAYANNNSLVVTDYAENVARIAQIVEAIDVPQGDITVIAVRHGAAADLAATITRLLAEPAGGSADPSQRVTVMADSRTNQLLVRSENPSRISAVRQLLANLDRPGAAGNIRVVYLKNAEATRVAQTLRAVLAGDSGALSTATPATALSGGGNTAAATASGAGQATGQTGTPSGAGLAQGAGMVQADALNNAIIITGPEPVYNNLRAVIEQLDRRRAQVYVEALVAEISAERAAEFGIQWQSTNLPTDANSKGTVFGGTNFGATSSGKNILGVAANPTSLASGLNLLVGGGTVKIPGTSTEILNIGLLARFLESEAKANILSTPNIITLDNEEAKIVIGRNVPFVTGQFTTNTGGGTTTGNPFQTIERKDVGLTLKIKPQISEGGAIHLQIFQEASSVIESTTANTTGPTTNKRSIESTVLADDGAIIAIGGLVEDSYSNGEDKVPVLGDVPVVGGLFRYDTRKRSKTNLVVFLRPKILRDSAGYAGLTADRYDYVIGEQKALDRPARPAPAETAGPRLPPRLDSGVSAVAP